MKNKDINVKGTVVSIIKKNNADFMSLTDIAKFKDSTRSDYILQNWMRLRSTIEFIGLWEVLHNSNFKPIEFDGFKNQAGQNSFSLTPKRWIESTDAIGITSKSGRYGGTFAHKDIAFEFASWISAEFKLYLIKEFQRLKEDENIRDYASIEQLVVLSNLESINSVLIHHGLNQSQRLKQLNVIAITQMKSLVKNNELKKLS